MPDGVAPSGTIRLSELVGQPLLPQYHRRTKCPNDGPSLSSWGDFVANLQTRTYFVENVGCANVNVIANPHCRRPPISLPFDGT